MTVRSFAPVTMPMTEILRWMSTEFVTMTVTTESGTRYTVVKRPGKPTVVIHPDGNRPYAGSLRMLPYGGMELVATEPWTRGAVPTGRRLLKTTRVVDIYVLEN